MKNITKLQFFISPVVLGLFFLLLLPKFAFAQFGGLRTFIIAAQGIISLLIVTVAAIALLVFFWGLVKFIFHAGDAETHKEGRQFMLWGIIALFVMVSVWGLVRFIQLNLGIQSGGIFRIENLNSNTGASGSQGWRTQSPPTTPPTGSGGGPGGDMGCGTDTLGNPIICNN